jgi:hypothetical protein
MAATAITKRPLLKWTGGPEEFQLHARLEPACTDGQIILSQFAAHRPMFWVTLF